MAIIAIRLDPGRLDNADLDIRYILPDRIVERSKGAAADGGYDYGRTSEALIVFLCTESPDVVLPIVLDVLQTEVIHGNRLAGAATVGLSAADDFEDETAYDVIFPSTSLKFTLE